MNQQQQRFVKLDATGAHLPDDAQGHVAVLDRLPRADGLHRIWPVANLTAKATTVDKLEAEAKKLELLGANDFELSTFDELSSLVDRSRAGPCINEEFFPGTKSDWYASSTPYANDASYVWVQLFDYGYAYIGSRHGKFFGRAVRRVAPGQ